MSASFLCGIFFAGLVFLGLGGPDKVVEWGKVIIGWFRHAWTCGGRGKHTHDLPARPDNMRLAELEREDRAWRYANDPEWREVFGDQYLPDGRVKPSEADADMFALNDYTSRQYGIDPGKAWARYKETMREYDDDPVAAFVPLVREYEQLGYSYFDAVVEAKRIHRAHAPRRCSRTDCYCGAAEAGKLCNFDRGGIPRASKYYGARAYQESRSQR